MKKQNSKNKKRTLLGILLLMSAFFLWSCGGNDPVDEPQGEGPAPVETPGSQEQEAEKPEQGETVDNDEVLTAEELSDLFAKGKDLNEFYYEMKVSGLGEEDGLTRMYMKDGLMRVESEIMGQNFMMIYSEDAFYTLDPQSKTAMKMPMGAEGNEDREAITMDDFIDDLDDENMTYIGKETVNGISCHIVESREQNSDSQVKMWLHEEYGIPMRIETTTGNDNVHVMEVTDFKTDSISDDLFVLPDGYKIIDLENLIPKP